MIEFKIYYIELIIVIIFTYIIFKKICAIFIKFVEAINDSTDIINKLEKVENINQFLKMFIVIGFMLMIIIFFVLIGSLLMEISMMHYEIENGLIKIIVIVLLIAYTLTTIALSYIFSILHKK